MRPPPADPARPSSSVDDDLELPALDGEDDEADKAEADAHEDLDVRDDGGDAFDDATADDEPIEVAVAEGAEAGWLVDADEASTVDVGTFDLSLGDERDALDEPDEAHAPAALDDDLDVGDESIAADSGEEGPLADDEELREEDLPALDADEDGEIDDEALYDRSLIGEDELRWDDRAWERAPAADAVDEADDSGMLAVPGDDAENVARDATWRRFEESGQLTAATLLPGGSVVVALDTSDRAVVVRIRPDGVARIIAEIEAPGGSEDEDGDTSLSRVVSLRWDAAHGVLVASGAFGVQAFKPV